MRYPIGIILALALIFTGYTLTSGQVVVNPESALSATSGSIGGGALLAGGCASGAVTVSGATTEMAATASPVTYPGDGTLWSAHVSAANTVTVKVCAIIALTPTASTYRVRVIK